MAETAETAEATEMAEVTEITEITEITGMTGTVDRPLPAFAEFYRAVNGREPFPWQARLADRVARNGSWPAEVGIPTGLGKTGCLDIAVWWLASQAGREPAERTAPTRIWWVVNERPPVDSTARHARRFADALAQALAEDAQAADPAVAAVAGRLRSLWPDREARPLDVIRFSGGVPSSHSPTDAARPTVLLCTLAEYGSRLLFRGYGSSRPALDAGLAGTDSLVLLDEGCLAPHLRKLIAAVAECTPEARGVLGAARSTPQLAALTATGAAGAGIAVEAGDAGGKTAGRFGLDAADAAHPLVRRRLDAAKPMRITSHRGGLSGHVVKAALTLLQEAGEPCSCLVFLNAPDTAREVFARLRIETGDAAEVLLLTGLNREREARRIRRRVLDPIRGMPAGRPATLRRERHLVVVATRNLEAGADIDAERLVTETCGVRALTQRLGRLNRLGRFDDRARAIYVHARPAGRGAKSGWPVYGTEPEAVVKRLLQAAEGDPDGNVNMSPGTIAEVLGPPLDAPDRVPEVLPGILWEWVKTTTPPEGEAPVEPYFAGIGRARSCVSLLWRVHVPDAGRRLWPRASDREVIEVPVAAARAVFRYGRIARLGRDGVTVEATRGRDLVPGDTVIVPSDRGLVDAFGWNPSSRDPVVDVSLEGRGLPLDAGAIRRLCGVQAGDHVQTALGIGNDDDDDIDMHERRAAARALVDELRAAPPPHGWNASEWDAFGASLGAGVEEARREVPRLPAGNPRRHELPGDDFDELSMGPADVGLYGHGEAVARRARATALKLGLPDGLVDVVARAAMAHDLGKADPRYQAWLDPDGTGDRPLAKSRWPRHRWEALRVASGWPRGGRHEGLSARLVGAWLDRTPGWGTPLQRDLLVHLVISHHGGGRPLLRPTPDGSGATVSGVVDGVPVRAPADLAVIDWQQPERFARLHRALGPWSLALLEAIVVRADHAVSQGPARILEASP